MGASSIALGFILTALLLSPASAGSSIAIFAGDLVEKGSGSTFDALNEEFDPESDVKTDSDGQSDVIANSTAGGSRNASDSDSNKESDQSILQWVSTTTDIKQHTDDSPLEVTHIQPSDVNVSSVFQQRSDRSGWHRKGCPKIYPPDNVMPNLIFVKIQSASDLPYRRLSKVDPYVKFWVGQEKDYNSIFTNKNWESFYNEKKWLGKTPYKYNNRDPAFDFGCLLSYGGDEHNLKESGVLHLVVMDRNKVMKDTFLGSVRGQGIPIRELFEHDQRGTGLFDVSFPLFKKDGKTEVKGRKRVAKLNVQFQVVWDPSKYMPEDTSTRHRNN